jgi:soluble lytic murein transglycosylase-like protein
MGKRALLCLAAAVVMPAGGAAPAGATDPSSAVPVVMLGIDGLARAGQWERVLTVARVRNHQLPLQPEEALVVAGAARRLGDAAAQAVFLDQALRDEKLGRVAEVELAELVVSSDAERAAELALRSLSRSRQSRAMREAAVAVLVRALEAPLEPETRSAIDQRRRRLGRTDRVALDVALARGDETAQLRRLRRVLTASSRGQAALAAAWMLDRQPEQTRLDSWMVARTLFRHGLYGDAAPRLERLAGSREGGVPAWEVAFLRGRCDFRSGRWKEAAAWYQRALPLAPSRDRRAGLEVHLARALELQGEIDDAAEAARRAVLARASDERRLLLARLRLRQGQPDLAELGVSRIRGRWLGDRGRMLIALDELRRGDTRAATGRLEAIRSRSWVGTAAVLVASVAVAEGRWDDAMTSLERGAGRWDPYWELAARRLVGRIPGELVTAWRLGDRQVVDGTTGSIRRRALARWAALETDGAAVRELRELVGDDHGLDELVDAPEFQSSTAASLWRLGLQEEASRWYPRSFPDATAAEVLWSARALLELGRAARAITLADQSWKMAAAWLPVRLMPRTLREAYHPLPWPETVRAAAEKGTVPWQLLAAVARAESRWSPEAVSAVGARGLTQLMPATAAAVAERLDEPLPSPADLFRPQIALEFGAAELGRLLSTFDGAAAPALAAYNAGEEQARLWLEECGADCSEELYVAGITFTATRAYVGDVLASAATYDELYQ